MQVHSISCSASAITNERNSSHSSAAKTEVGRNAERILAVASVCESNVDGFKPSTLHPKKRGLCGTTTLVSERHFWIRLGSARVSRDGFGVSPKRTSNCYFLFRLQPLTTPRGSWTEKWKNSFARRWTLEAVCAISGRTTAGSSSD